METNLGNLVGDSYLFEIIRHAAANGVQVPNRVAFTNRGGIRNNNVIGAGPPGFGGGFV